MMKKLNLQTDPGRSEAESLDLARRLTRYRTRLEAEGRKRSLQVIDRAIRDAETDGATDA